MESTTEAVYSNEIKSDKEHNIENNRPEHVLNGVSNGIITKSDGHHKHKHKDKDRDKHQEKHKHKDKDKDREKNSNSSNNKDKHKDKEHRDKDKHHRSKDKDHTDKEKDHKDKDREKHKDKDRDHHRSKEHRTKDKDKKHRDKDGSKEANDKHNKDHRDKHKDHKSSSGGGDGKEKEHKSSSSSSKSKDTIGSSGDKNKDQNISISSSKHSSTSNSVRKHSSSKEKDGHNKEKSGKDRDKERDRQKTKHSSSGEKHSSSEKSSSNNKCSSSDKSKYSQPDAKLQNSSTDNRSKLSNELNSVKQEPTDHVDAVNSVAHKVEHGSKFKEEQYNSQEFKVKDEPLTGNESFNNIKCEPKNYENDAKDEIVTEGSQSGDSGEESSQRTEDSDEDIPLAKRNSVGSAKRQIAEDSDDSDVPLSARKKVKKEKVNNKKRKKEEYDDESEEDYKPKKKNSIKKTPVKKEVKSEPETPSKKKKKGEEEQEVWKWWEEEKKDDGVKWKFLEHKGPMFAPPYEPLPEHIKFYYNGKEKKLSQDAEEIATFYARLIEHEYTTKEAFNTNFFKDWRRFMTSKEKETITDLKKCDFKKIHDYFVQKSEERKAMSKEEKKKIKEENEKIANEYGFCTIDGHKEKIGNFKIEPPGLFRGRGEHPKMGKLKRRIIPEDIIINCSKDSNYPVAPKGHKWKEVRHDNTVTWLASWTENVQGQVKYIMLNPSSKLKGEKDWQKYEVARKLAKHVENIRKQYREDWKSKEMRIRQRAVALYFIDRLALRAGNEKDEDQADTVGCCSLRVEHIQLHEEKDGKNYVVVFDFLGKDSIRYYNEVPVEKRVFKNLQLFCERKAGGDDLFDRLNTQVMNKHLNELMEGLTAKVFRTFNASFTLQNQLNELTDPDASVPEKILQYNRANRAVAILCNHQRSVPKSHEKSMGNLKQKIDAKKEQVATASRQCKDAKREAKDGSSHSKMNLEKKKKALERLKEQLMKLEVQETDREENKTIALGTSKLNYLDPRISVAWCKKHGVPIEKIYNKTQRSKFRWAIDMAGPDYVF